MSYLGLEVRISVSTADLTGYSSIGPSRICPREFLQIGIKCPSDMGALILGVCILLSLVIFGPCGRGEIVKERNNKSYVNSCLDVPHSDPLF